MEIEILKRASAYFARYNFLDPGAADFYDDWDGAADTTVALLRAEAGRHPHDKALRELVGELTTLSPASPPCSAGSTGRRVHRFGPHLSLASRRHGSCTWSATASTSTARPPATTPSSINPYEHYPAPIFAVPGNHDGENLEGQQSLDGFVRNFCAATRGIHRPEAQDAPRTAMTVPTSRPYSGRRPLGGRLLD